MKKVQSINIKNTTISLTSISTSNFKKNLELLYNFIEKENSIELNIKKIHIFQYLLDKIHNIYRVPKEKLTTFYVIYRDIIVEDDTLLEFLKVIHCKFFNIDFAFKLSKDIFYINKERTIPIFSIPIYFQVVKHLLRSSLVSVDMVNEICNDLLILYRNPTTSIYIKMEIADIFLLIGHTTTGNLMLQGIRIVQDNNDNTEKVNTVFGDSQNVHNITINNTVLQACQNLIKYIDMLNGFFKVYKLSLVENNIEDQRYVTFELTKLLPKLLYRDITSFDEIYNLFEIYIKDEIDLESIENNLTSISSFNKDIIHEVITRVYIETTIFGTFNLEQLFMALWQFILYHNNSNELKGRLIEEIVEMHKYCTTGHISRFINTIQGYTDIDELQIKISSEDQLIAVVTTYLSNSLSVASEEVMDSMLEDDKTLFLNYTINLVNKKLEEWSFEYGLEIYDYIINIYKNYTKYSNITLHNNKLVLTYN